MFTTEQVFSIAGGYTWNGGTYPHLRVHLEGNLVPTGGFAGFKEAHVEWQNFQNELIRTSSNPWFWR